MQNPATYFWREAPKLTVAWGLLLMLTALRIVYAGLFPLSADEAYYWQWSRYLDLGYHDHPPMVAWMIWLSTTLLGTHEATVRLPAIVALFGASAYLLELARRWYGTGVALSIVLLTQGLLLFNVGALIVTPDSFQALAWAGACYHLARAYEADRTRHWCLGGIWFGIGMLSKLSMAIFAPLVFIFGLISPQHRRRLKGWRPYLGFCLGLCIMLPLVFWNQAHDWRAFRHVAHQGGVDNGAWFVPRYFGDYLLSQLALLSPIVFLLFLAALARGRRLWQDSTWMDRYLWMTSMPVFLLFALLSTHTRVEGNWPAFGYFGACVLIAAQYHGRRLWRWAIGTAGVMTLIVLIQVVYPLIPLPAKADRIAHEFGDWRPIGEAVARINNTLPGDRPPFIFALDYQTASKLAFYTPGRPHTVALNRGRRPNTYDYWWADADLIGRDAVGVAKRPDLDKGQLTQFFDVVDPPQKVTLWDHRAGWNGRPKPIRTLYIYRAHGFKGGHRWVPEKGSDIRTSRPKASGPPPPKES
ncbi:MAG: glycosyltransferase family 39 protein [Desulfosarcinaceae bacterium]